YTYYISCLQGTAWSRVGGDVHLTVVPRPPPKLSTRCPLQPPPRPLHHVDFVHLRACAVKTGGSDAHCDKLVVGVDGPSYADGGFDHNVTITPNGSPWVHDVNAPVGNALGTYTYYISCLQGTNWNRVGGDARLTVEPIAPMILSMGCSP